MAARLSFGLQLPQDTGDPARLRAVAETAERCGYDSLWVYDHFYGYPTPASTVALEPFTLLGWLAGWTRRARLGTLVLCDAYRPPALTAKMAASLDVLSGGRLELGYGAGWHDEEARGYGYDFPPAATRIARMEEGLAVMKLLWSEPRATFAGAHYRLAGAACDPKPAQRPWPPITIGGGGELLLLRAVARHADVWNYFPVPLAEYERKLGVLRVHCRTVGRDPATLAQSLLVRIVTAEKEREVRDRLEVARRRGVMFLDDDEIVQGTPDIVVPRLLDYARLGVSSFIVALPDPSDLAHVELVAREVVAALR
jgi:F420-dependent oxidoreductase-like protein